MGRAKPQDVDRIFAALADPTRRAMLLMLAERPCNASDLAEPHDMTPPAITNHLRVLEGAGLIVRHRRGREHVFQAQLSGLAQATAWVSRYRELWEQQFDNLENYLSQMQDPKQ